jgi:hypothetical protein
LKVLYKGKGVDLKRDAARQAKPIGYRFKGKHNYRIPKNLDNPNVYYEGRPDKGDAYQNKRRGVYFADGGMTEGQSILLKSIPNPTYERFYNKEVVIEELKGNKITKAFVRSTGEKVPFVIDLNTFKVEKYADGGMMADGGMTKERENLEEAYKRKLITKKEYEDEISKLMMPRSGAYGKKGMSSSIREYYMNAFPTDDMGADINPNATFKGLLHTLDSGKEVYNYIGVYDSLVRERVFEKLSELTGLDYAVIYDKWLKTAADGGIMARGGKTKKLYYHILEYGNYGNIGYQGYYDTQEEAQKEVKRLQGYFPNLTFQIFVDTSRNEPPITTMADGGMMARGGKTSRYNEGLSWHQDHARHNSSEKYEVPVKRRKK